MTDPLDPYRSRTGWHLAIDTNTIDDESEAMAALRQLHREGWINLTRTDTMDTELAAATDPAKRAALLARSAEYVEHLGPVVFDHSRFDFAVFASDIDETRRSTVFAILFPGADPATTRKQNVRDAMHVATAIRYGANGFVTNDTNTLDHHAEIRRAFNDFGIYSPERALATSERRVAALRKLGRLRRPGYAPPEP